MNGESSRRGESYVRYLPIHQSSSSLTILSPLILAADLLLLFRSEVVGDVKGLSDFLWGLALDHVGDSLAADIEERLDIEIVRGLETKLALGYGL